MTKEIAIQLAVAGLLISQLSGFAADWPQWLGPNRDGVWRETEIIDEFPESGPPLKWTTRIGGGYSGPAVAGDLLIVLDRIATPISTDEIQHLHDGPPPRNRNFLRQLLPGSERVLCLNANDGSVRWIKEYDCPYTVVSDYATGPRTTPVIEGNRVYTLGTEGHLYCLRTDTGETLWSKQFKKDYGYQTSNWGVSAHPLIDGDLLYCMVGGPNATVVAFNKHTGAEVWRALNARDPGYCPPVIHTFGGKRQLLVWDSDNLSGLSPKTGEVYWSVEVKATYAMAISTPRVSGNSIFIMSYNHQSHRIDVSKDGNSAEVVWKGNTRIGIGGVMNTPVIDQGHIYACGSSGRYTCARLDTGERLWTSYEPAGGKRLSWGTVFTVQHQSRYFLFNDIGDLIIAKLSPAGYEEVSRAHLIDPTHKVGNRTLVWTHPAFAHRNVYVRNDDELKCYSLAKRQRN